MGYMGYMGCMGYMGYMGYMRSRTDIVRLGPVSPM